MQALVKSKAQPGLWLEEVPVPETGINDVLIRVRKTGICGTDLALVDALYPFEGVPGHEFVGDVVALGEDRVLLPEASKTLKQALKARGFAIYDPDLSMITQGGGGVHCMCQSLIRDPV